METPVAGSNEDQDWVSLPPGVLQLIFNAASTWQAPGSCRAAPVCRTWRAAAAGCKVTHLLYLAGHPAADKSFGTWLGRRSQHLQALVISSDDFIAMHDLLDALAHAAAAAVAAGRPLPLHTLRVLGYGPEVLVTGRLLAGLPNLRCFQLSVWSYRQSLYLRPDAREGFAPLQQATQLQELYLTGPPEDTDDVQYVADRLPASLKRLSWTAGQLSEPAPDLSHLRHLDFLRLDNWLPQPEPLTSKLPPGLQQLELKDMCYFPSELQQEWERLTGYDIVCPGYDELQPLSQCINLQSLAAVWAGNLAKPEVCAALQQLVALSAVQVNAAQTGQQNHDVPPAIVAASSLKGLRCLHLVLPDLMQTPGQLAALTQLTQLKVSLAARFVRQQPQQEEQQHLAWAAEVGRMSWLRWLSVPAVVLAPDQGWLGGLKQLQVLVLTAVKQPANVTPTPEVMSKVAQWLGECGLQQLPPRLLLLGFTGVKALQALSQQQRRRLQARLGSRGCEVVVGADLDEVCDPVKQMAGLPAGLQRALA